MRYVFRFRLLNDLLFFAKGMFLWDHRSYSFLERRHQKPIFIDFNRKSFDFLLILNFLLLMIYSITTDVQLNSWNRQG